MHRVLKPIAFFLAVILTTEGLFPPVATALTGGPAQPEFSSFTPVGTTDMVDPFTGDFTYNIPLMDVDGYPINLAYHSGIAMDQEASWVGLGWNINMGVINRAMRGLPDDFNGDLVKKEFNVEENITRGVKLGYGRELIGLSKEVKKRKKIDSLIKVDIDFNLGAFWNSYRGLGFEFGVSPSISAGFNGVLKGGIGLGLGYSTFEGLSTSWNANASTTLSKLDKSGVGTAYSFGGSVGESYNCRTGAKTRMLSTSMNISVLQKGKTEGTTSSVSLFSSNGGSSIPIGTQSYVPQIQMPMTSKSGSLTLKLGTAAKFRHQHGSIHGYFSRQYLATREQSNPAYGYFHTHNGMGSTALLDFNIEKDGPFSEKTPNLPVANLTYDIYSASGHGVSGIFRPFRGSVGVLSDALQTSDGTGRAIGGDVGLGDLVHIGLTYSLNYTSSRSGRWYADNSAGGFYRFLGFGAHPSTPFRPLYEPFYFKLAGEKTIGEPVFDAGLGGDRAERLRLNGDGGATATLESEEDNGPGQTGSARSRREKRQTVMTVLTAIEASTAGLSRWIEESPMNDFAMPYGRYKVTRTPRVNDNAKEHHISEMTVLDPKGTRYVYGIPAYNTHQKEVTFNVADRGGNCATGFVSYGDTTIDSNVMPDNSIYNQRGIDNYFNATTLPAYAHSYLLTAVLSPDYADRTGDGVTDDDHGTAIRINYTRADGAFHWRVPFGKNEANYNEGMKSDPKDDKGSYIYGTKEVWYAHSIETKTHVAEFYLSGRLDGFGVIDENGGLEKADSLYRLDSIKLYSKEDRIRHGANAVPVKTAHFEYSYRLCPRIPNHSVNEHQWTTSPKAGNWGKLTLDRVYFTYGALPKGRLNDYGFTYWTFNPNYNIKGYDRWGNYKEPKMVGCSDIGNSASALTNSDDPYVEQNKDTADKYASAWHLTGITLPSRGTISITYEADDYAYVQDKRAMRMFKVLGVAKDTGKSLTYEMFENTHTIGDLYRENLWLCVDLPPNVTTRDQFFDRCIGRAETPLYFRFLVDIIDGNHEYVNGYAAIEDWNVTSGPGAQTYRGWIKLKRTTLRDNDKGDYAHPISKAAWQKARLEMSSKIFPGSDPKGTDESPFKGLLGFFSDIVMKLTGFNRALRRKGFGRNMVPNKSFVRLMEPSMCRFGGGSRVRMIETSDKWKEMTGNTATAASYGQVFTYTMSGDEPGRANDTSSGVAAYEPMIGGDENPFHQPVFFTNERDHLPDDLLYTEEPFGEAFFPDPSVGYRRVTVRDIHRTGEGPAAHTATGKVVYEFYTAFDFPVRASRTYLTPGESLRRKKPKLLRKPFQMESLDYLTASQGYAIVGNDMHGKPRAQWTYAENGVAPLSGIEYHYKTEPGDPRRLNNSVLAIDTAGIVRTEIVGRDIEMSLMMRETMSTIEGTDLMGNADVTSPFFLFPTAWGKITTENTRFRSAVATKVIHQYGILDRVEAHEDGASVATENVAYDAETGEVLLTKTTNTFHDPVYNFTYPAHWAYDGMGPACRNVGVRLTGVTIHDGGFCTIPNAAAYLVRGDEILLTPAGGGAAAVAWVLALAGNEVKFVDRYGRSLPDRTYNLLVVRSGRRNEASAPIGTVTSLSNPLISNRILAFKEVLNAEAIEYSDIWRTSCGTGGIGTLPYTKCDTTLTPGAASLVEMLGEMIRYERHSAQKTTIGNTERATKDSGSIWIVDAPCATTFHLGPNIKWSDIHALGDVIPDPAATPPNPDHQFLIAATLENGSTTTIRVTAPCTEIFDIACTDIGQQTITCGVAPGDTVNPFIYGMWGNWRRARSHAYLTERGPGTAVADVNTRKNGAYLHFTPFWLPPSIGHGTTYPRWHPSPVNWIWTTQVTRYSPEGFEVENQDALGRYSGALYGYMNTLPTAVAANARYRQIAFDGFEDYDVAGAARRCLIPRHWDFALSGVTHMLDNSVSHTGLFSLKLEAGASASVSRGIEEECVQQGALHPIDYTKLRPFNYRWLLDSTSASALTLGRLPDDDGILDPDAQNMPDGAMILDGNSANVLDENTISGATLDAGELHDPNLSNTVNDVIQPTDDPGISLRIFGQTLDPYTLQPCDCNGLFSPEPDRTYVFSGWAREELTPPLFANGHAEVSVQIKSGTTVLNAWAFTPSGLVVEGWRRIDTTFTIPAGATEIVVTLGNAGSDPVWFDDLRIHPFDATMKTYVYHPYTMRLMGILDERNYATLYEYAYEGHLIRLKRETERGVVTIQESRMDLRKIIPPIIDINVGVDSHGSTGSSNEN